MDERTIPDEYYNVYNGIERIRSLMRTRQMNTQFMDLVMATIDGFYTSHETHEDIDFSIGISYPEGGSAYVNFSFTNDTIEIESGGSEYDPNVGSDSFSGASLFLDNEGFCDPESDSYQTMETALRLLIGGASLQIESPEEFADHEEEMYEE